MKDAKDKRTDSIQGVRTKAWPTLTGGVLVSGCDCSRRKASLAYYGPVVNLDWNKQRCRAEAACRLSFLITERPAGSLKAGWRFLPSLVMCLMRHRMQEQSEAANREFVADSKVREWLDA
jgi:hypothetical protein